jgi:hypothetical protein
VEAALMISACWPSPWSSNAAATPIFWRAYEQSVLKGRTKRYELAVVSGNQRFSLSL